MSGLSELESVLETVDNTQESIKAFTRVALQGLLNPKEVVTAWRDELSRRLIVSQDPLPLVYCCNDVLQESKGSAHEDYCTKFKEILEDELKAVLQEKPGLRRQVEKVISVWRSRRVFDKAFIKHLRVKVLAEAEDDEDSESEESRNNEHRAYQDDQAGDRDVQQVVDPVELQREALATLSAAKLIAVSDFIERELKARPRIDLNTLETTKKRVRAALDSWQGSAELSEILSQLKEQLEVLKARRRCLQGSAPVHAAAQNALEALVRRSEESMQHAMEDLGQCEQIEKMIQLLAKVANSNIVEAKYKSMHLIPKREKVKQEVAQGPDLSNSKERVLKEGLSAEAAVKSERPLVFHKGLQKWIPLPSGDDADNWRD